MGLSGLKWPAQERRDCRLGRFSHYHLHNPSIQHCVHQSGFSRWCSFRRCIRSDLSCETRAHSEDIPQTQMEPWEVEQAFPVHRHFLEWLGRCHLVLAVRFPRYGWQSELCPSDHGDCHNFRHHIVLRHSCREMVAVA